MSDLNVGRLNSTAGVKFPEFTTATRPSGVTGLTIFNIDKEKLEVYDGSSWVDIGQGEVLDGSTEELAAPDAAWIWDNRVDKTAGLQNSLRWIKLPGTSTAYRVWCNFENNGGGGPAGTRHGWMLIYQNYGGPRANGTISIQGQSSSGRAQSQYSIWNGTDYYDDTLIPKKDGGQYICGKTHIWDLVKNDGGWDVMKAYNLYDSTNNPINFNYPSTDSGNMGIFNQGAYAVSRQTRQVYDILSARDVPLIDIYGTSIGGGSSGLSNFVGLHLDSGNHGGHFDWGETNTLNVQSGNRGFSNNTDNLSTPRMYGWAARHWLSYSSNTTGRDAHRCQYICWGSEDYAIEISLYVRKNFTPS